MPMVLMSAYRWHLMKVYAGRLLSVPFSSSNSSSHEGTDTDIHIGYAKMSIVGPDRRHIRKEIEHTRVSIIAKDKVGTEKELLTV